MTSKQNDLMLNILANPQFSIEDFLKVGLSAKNTSLEDENTYLSSDIITKNPLFLNASGEFDKAKFHNIYILAAKGLEQINSEPQDFKAVYSKYNIWAPTTQRENSPGFELVKINNPDRITKSMLSIGQNGPREFTPLEIAQSQKVWDSDKLEWMDTPEDMFSFNKLFNDFTGFFSDNFSSTKVMATYDEDIDVNGKKRGEIGFDESQIEHQKGDYMLNENGTYYYRTLKDGENIYGKLVLHYSDILTREGSALNAVDFLDSDDIQKSGFGSFVKNASLIGAMFIPGGVGTAIAGATIFQQAAGLGATLGKLALGLSGTEGDKSTILNWFEGLSEATNPINTRSEWSSIDYGNTGRNTTWTIENLLGMVGDVVGQLKQQRLLFEYSPYILKGKWGINQKNQQLLEEKFFNELQQQSKGKVLSALEQKDVLKAIQAQEKLTAINKLKAADMVESYMKDYQKAGEELSKAYMTLLTVNDIYGEAKEAGAEDFDAAVITAAYAAMEYALLSTDVGKWILPELRGERLQNKAMLHALTSDIKESFKKLGKAAGESDEAKRTYLQKLVDFGKSVARGEFNVGLGKRAFFKDGEGLLKAGIGSLVAGATAEAVEETTEEVLADFSRVLFNGLEQLRGKDVRLKPFENAFDRYGMSFLGGFIGGGVSSAAFDFRNAQRTANMSYDEAMQQLIHKAHNNDLDGIYKILDKEEVGNKNLSAKKFDKDENGNIIWKQGDENDNQDLAIKNLVRRLLNMIENTLNAHGGKTDDEILDIHIMRDLRYRALRNTTTAGLFLLKYNELLTELVKTTNDLNNLNTPAAKAENGESDKKDSENENIVALRKSLELKIKDLDEKLQEFHTGAKAPLFMATALIESTPYISQALMASTFRIYAEVKSGKKFNNIPESELKNLETQYQKYLESDKKDDLQLATKSYLVMLNLIGENLNKSQEILRKQMEDPIISQLLLDTSKVFEGLDFQQDEDKWLESFGKWAEGNQALSDSIGAQVSLLYNTYKENLSNNLKVLDEANSKIGEVKTAVANLKKLKEADIESKFNLGELAGGISEETRNTSIAELDNWEKEEIKTQLEKLGLSDITVLEKEKEKANQKSKEDLDKALQDLIFKTGVAQANKLADTVLSQGFINGAIKNQVIDKLIGMSQTLDNTYSKALEAFYNALENDISPNTDLYEVKDFIKLGDLDVVFNELVINNLDFHRKLLESLQQYTLAKLELDAKINLVKNLKYTPIMNNLDAFALNIGKAKVSLLFDTLGKILSTSRLNVSTFNMSGNLYKQIGEAERVLDLYIASLEGARTDNVDPFKIGIGPDGKAIDLANVWGINKVINEVHAKSPKVEGENWVDLPEIEGSIADMMLEDAKRLKKTLHTYKQLYSINQGQKLNVLRRVSAKTSYLLYRKVISLITNCELPDKEKLISELNTLSFLKEETSKSINDWNINLNKELEKKLEKERIQMEDSIFEYFKDKINDLDALKLIFNPKNFVLYNDTATLLSEGSEEIDDTSFIGYLASKAAIKSSALQNRLKEIYKDGNIAPLIGQEISIHLGLANILNGKAITNIITAYRSNLLEMSIEERKEFLTKAGYSNNAIEAYSTESGIKLFINDDLVPQYDNITFIDGIPGAGKSAAVDAVIYKYIKLYHPELKNKAWVTHGGDTKEGEISKKFANDIGFDKDFENAFDKTTMMKQIFPEYNAPKLNTEGNYTHAKDDYIIDTNGKIQPTWKIDSKWNSDNVPAIIFIDEAQQFTQLELLALDKFAKKFGIAIVTSGDLNQSLILGEIDCSNTIKEINKESGKELLDPKNPLKVKLTRNQILHTFKLGTSMRTSNNLKNINMANTEVVMSNGEGNLELHYYEDENTIAGDLLLKTLTLDPVLPYIDKIIPQLKNGEKIHFALPTGDPFKTQLLAIEKYNKVIEFHDGVALGQEGEYWIVKFSDVDNPSFKQDFYTGQTRSKRFSLMLVPEKVLNGKVTITNILDLETHKEEYSPAAVKKYSAEHVAVLTEILPKDMEDIPYNPREGFEEEVELKSKPLATPDTSLSKEEKKEKRKHFIEALEKKQEKNTEEEIPEESSTEEETVENSLNNPTKDADYYNNAMAIASTHNEVDALYNEAINNGIDEHDIFGTYSKRHKEIDDLSKKVSEENSSEIDLHTLEIIDRMNNCNTVEELNNFYDGLNDEDLENNDIYDYYDSKYKQLVSNAINENNSIEQLLEWKEDLELGNYEDDKYFLDLINKRINELKGESEVKPDIDIFEEENEPSPEEISPIEDLSIEEALDLLDEDNGILKDSDELNVPLKSTGFGLRDFKYTLFGNSSFEVGTHLINKESGTYQINENFLGYRIDGVNGIENTAITNENWVEIRNTKNLQKAEAKLGYIRKLLLSTVLDKSQIIDNINKDMGLQGHTYVRYAVKTSSLDLRFDRELFLKLEKDPEEESRYARALRKPKSESNKTNNRFLVAIIGTEENGDIIEIPLLNFNNPVTIIRDLDEEHPIRITFERAYKDAGKLIVPGLLAVKNYIENDAGYQGLNDLISLYLADYRHILFIPDEQWTPGRDLYCLGVQLNSRRGWKNYDNTDYIQTRQYNSLDELRADPTLHRISKPLLLNNKDGKISNPENSKEIIRIANPKHPFVLYTDQVFDHNGKRIRTDEDLQEEFLWLQFHNVPQTIQLVYILPPQFTLEEYLKSLVKFMVDKGPSPYGNQRTAYKILEALFINEKNGDLLNCFKKALGEHDGQLLYDKTASVIGELMNLVNGEGEPDITKLVKILTTRTESWELGNVGIPKNIPLYRQLLNVLKQLVYPQKVVMENTDEGFQLYVSHKGIDKFDTLFPALNTIFERAQEPLYHLVKGSKTDRGLFVKIQTDENGHFTNGEDFTVNGSISSSAFEINEHFNKMLHKMVKEIRYVQASEDLGEIIKTSDNIFYVYLNYSGFHPNNRQFKRNDPLVRNLIIPSLHLSIIQILKRVGATEEEIKNIENGAINSGIIKTENDLNPSILNAIAELINASKTSIKALVVNNLILLGNSKFFENKNVQFGEITPTSRGKELTVIIDGEKFNGNLVNGELILQSLPVVLELKQNNSSVDDTNLINIVQIMLDNPAGWSNIKTETGRNKMQILLESYKANPTPEMAAKILKNRNFQELLKNFEITNTDDNLQSKQEQQTCSREIKIKFN